MELKIWIMISMFELGLLVMAFGKWANKNS